MGISLGKKIRRPYHHRRSRSNLWWHTLVQELRSDKAATTYPNDCEHSHVIREGQSLEVYLKIYR